MFILLHAWIKHINIRQPHTIPLLKVHELSAVNEHRFLNTIYDYLNRACTLNELGLLRWYAGSIDKQLTTFRRTAVSKSPQGSSKIQYKVHFMTFFYLVTHTRLLLIKPFGTISVTKQRLNKSCLNTKDIQIRLGLRILARNLVCSTKKC